MERVLFVCLCRTNIEKKNVFVRKAQSLIHRLFLELQGSLQKRYKVRIMSNTGMIYK